MRAPSSPPEGGGARASPARLGSAEPPAARLPGRARHNSALLRAELRGRPQRAEPAPGAGELLLLLPECHERSCVGVGGVPPGEGVARASPGCTNPTPWPCSVVCACNHGPELFSVSELVCAPRLARACVTCGCPPRWVTPLSVSSAVPSCCFLSLRRCVNAACSRLIPAR